MVSDISRKIITDRSEKSMVKYFEDIRKLEPLSREEELRLSILIKNGDEEALNKLITSNLKYVVKEAKRYQTGAIPLSELIAQGNLGAIKAAKRFDGSKGFKFITYMNPWIKQSILAYITEHGRRIRIPQNQVSLYSKISRFQESYQQNYGIYPSVDEIAEGLNETYDKINYLVNILERVVSMDSSLSSDDNSTVGEFIEDTSLEHPCDTLMSESSKNSISRMIKKLTYREGKIICKLFGVNGESEYTTHEIADELEISVERIRQIKVKALKKLKILANRNNIM